MRQRIRQEHAVVCAVRNIALGSGEVAEKRRLEIRDDVERVRPRDVVPEPSGIRIGLDFENAAGDERSVPLEKAVEIVAIDRRAALESEVVREGTGSPQVPPSRLFVAARQPAQPGCGPRTNRFLDSRSKSQLALRVAERISLTTELGIQR